MPTNLPERNVDDRPPTLRAIVAICLGYGMVAVVLIALVAYDSRVGMWIAQAAEAEFADAIPPAIPEPLKFAVRQPLDK